MFPAWKVVHLQEQHGMISAGEAERWKRGIYGLMLRWNLEPDDLI